MEEKKYIVYCYTSPENKKYVGITCKKPKERAGGDNGHNYKSCYRFYKAIQDFEGLHNFTLEILEENLLLEEACEKEKYYISFYDTTNEKFGYNISLGGEAPFAGRHHSEETKQKIREKLKTHTGENNPFYGKHHSPENIQKFRENRKGEKNPHYGKHCSIETKQKISNSLKGKLSGEKNPNYGNTGEKNPRSRKIYCLIGEKRIDFIGIREAARRMNLNSPNIIHSLKSNGKYSAGKSENKEKIYWYYAEEEEEKDEN